MLFRPPDPESPASPLPSPRSTAQRSISTATEAAEAAGATAGAGDPPHTNADGTPGRAAGTGPAGGPEADVTVTGSVAETPAARRTTARKATARKATPAPGTAGTAPAEGAPTAKPPRRTATPKKATERGTPTEAGTLDPETTAAKTLEPATTAAKTPDPETVGAAEPSGPEPATGETSGQSAANPPEPADPKAAATGAETAQAGASPRTPGAGLRATALRVLDHPGFAPELLALAAVRALGPGAHDWAAWHRSTYPGATPDGLARLATRRFVRLAGAGGATAALAGLFAPVAELAVVLWAQSSLVLHLAAAYGRDPADPERAVELLVLTRVHADAESARAALGAAQAAIGPDEQPWPRVADAARRLAAPLAAQAGGWLGLRVASRLVPGATVLAAATGDSAAAERLAARAVNAYRPPRAH